MRALRLARIALAAEALRWRLWGRRRGRQGALLGAALVFALLALALLHLALWLWFAARLGGVGGALVIAAGDAAISSLLVLTAYLGSGEGRLGGEAARLREQALTSLRAEVFGTALAVLLRLWRSEP